MIRIDRIKKVLEVIEADREHFDMAHWFAIEGDAHYDYDSDQVYSCADFEALKPGAGCGTSACLAGWTISLFGNEEQKRRAVDFGPTARRLLGLNWEQSSDLFQPPHFDTDGAEDRAIAHLRAIIDAGEWVDG